MTRPPIIIGQQHQSGRPFMAYHQATGDPLARSLSQTHTNSKSKLPYVLPFVAGLLIAASGAVAFQLSQPTAATNTTPDARLERTSVVPQTAVAGKVYVSTQTKTINQFTPATAFPVTIGVSKIVESFSLTLDGGNQIVPVNAEQNQMLAVAIEVTNRSQFDSIVFYGEQFDMYFDGVKRNPRGFFGREAKQVAVRGFPVFGSVAVDSGKSETYWLIYEAPKSIDTMRLEYPLTLADQNGQAVNEKIVVEAPLGNNSL